MKRPLRRKRRRRARSCALESLEDRRLMAVDTPIVDNVSAADVGASYAVVGGEVVRSGDETPIITLYWGDNDGGLDAASWDQSVSLGAQNGQFSLTIDSLAPQTAYYYRAFAENSFGSDWANTTASFFTEAPKTEGAAMYNDHVATGLTHVNVTSYAGDATSSGPLLDFATGQPTGVTLTTTGVRVDEYFNSSAFPTEGTDAAEIFAGAIGFDRGNVGISGNEAYEHLYSGLNPLASYEFAGTAIRGNDAYTNRWTLVTLEGAESFTPAHSAGDGVVTDGLAANQAAVWVGGNQDPGEGFVVRWTDIDPGTDGEFEIVSTQYTGAIPTSIHPGGFADGARAYAMAATRLVESVAGLAVLNADPSPGDALSASPTTMTIDFNLPVEAATLDAGDLTVNGVAASSATLIDEDTAEWSLPAGVIAGDYLLNVSPGAIQSTLGDPFLGYSAPFSVAAPPAVENAAAADVLSTTAAIGVDVLADGFDPPTVLLHWGDSDQGTDSAAWQNVVDLGRIDQGVVSIDLANLPQNTPHYYRAMASNAAGEVWASETASFSTLSAELPMVVNGSAANLSAFSADVSGEVVDTGDDVPSITVHYGTVDGGDDAAAWQQSVDVGLRSGP
ncbi:MAG: immunoglobulin domain-containing protein, partial [Planctomycetota bacterium]